MWNVPICQGPEASSKVGDRKGWDNEQQGPREECLGKSKLGNSPCDFLEMWDLMTGHQRAQESTWCLLAGPFPLGGRGMGNLLSPLKWDPLLRTEIKSPAECLAEQDVVSSGKANGHTSSQNRLALCKRRSQFCWVRVVDKAHADPRVRC